MLVVGHWRVFMSKTDQFWQYAARYLVSSSPDTNSYSDQRSSCSHTGANTRGGDPRFKPAQYRAKAGEYGELANIRVVWNKGVLFESWNRDLPCSRIMSNGLQTIIKHRAHGRGATSRRNARGRRKLVLRCLGAALIMQWNTLPAKLQRELFDNAGAMGELLNTSALRGQIARFLHKHKNDEVAAETTAQPSSPAN
jgi:hypothetical protein